MPTFIFVPRCLVCREPAAVVHEDKYLCGTCFLEQTLKRDGGGQAPAPVLHPPISRAS